MNCEEARKILLAVSETLTQEQKEDATYHLDLCPRCKGWLKLLHPNAIDITEMIADVMEGKRAKDRDKASDV
jgi:formate dehydrogenase maturation protein FdhE